MFSNSNFETLPHRRRLRTGRLFLWIFIALCLGALTAYVLFVGAPQNNTAPERLVISLSQKTAVTMDELEKQGFIKNRWVFSTLYHARGKFFIDAGGYTISKSMNAWELAGVFAKGPTMKWVIIPEGLRKEEIAEILAKALNWSELQKTEWITKDTVAKPDYKEGVYFPDTYLIPLSETPAEVAARLIAHFQEKLAPYAKEGLQQNIKWTTIVKFASIIQREAAGKSDMPIIAGVLWNRLEKDMRLEVDATLQYARGDVGNGWWAPISVADKAIDSPYNTYLYKGLPPTAIANAGLSAMDAVVNPAKTECLFYLHDSDKEIHCAKTYEEHKENIEKYLK